MKFSCDAAGIEIWLWLIAVNMLSLCDNPTWRGITTNK